jgi:hypothetical protein
MNLVTLARRLPGPARRRRSTSLAVESIEERLAPSPALPSPPAHIPSVVAPTFAPPEPCATLAPNFAPPEPC